MHATIREVMTPMPVSLSPDSSVREAARAMRDEGIGDVLVMDGERLVGVVTDRDLVIRCMAETVDLDRITIDQACSHDPYTLSPDSPVNEAVKLMREKAVRRVPVVENGHAVGIVSLGDLAQERDPTSVLADISAAPDDR